MKVFQIQIQTYRGDFVDYHGQKIFTGPIYDRSMAKRNLVTLQSMTKGHHFNYRIDEREAQGSDSRLIAA